MSEVSEESDNSRKLALSRNSLALYRFSPEVKARRERPANYCS